MKIYTKDFTRAALEEKLDEMQGICIANNLCLESGVDDEGEFFIINEPPAPTKEEIKKQLTRAVETYMNRKVRSERDYDSVDTCIGRYSNSPNPKYKAEAQAVCNWVTACWDYCYAQLDAFETGERGIPSAEELLAELPELEW